MIRTVPASLDSDVVAEIDRRLASVQTEHGVRIPWAIESGSRAWGFPSPDSDYDCRFFYVRRHDDYLSLWQQRDVIDTPLDKIFDVNGWDVAKALRLMAKGNATVAEWLRSPIVYTGDERFRDLMLEITRASIEPALVLRHYLHVAEARQPVGETPVPLKKVFYALRPSLALRWMRMRPGEATPPMNMGELIAESDLPNDVGEVVAELIELKSHTRELGTGPYPPAIAELVMSEIAIAHDAWEAAAFTDHAGRAARINAAFRTLVDEFAP